MSGSNLQSDQLPGPIKIACPGCGKEMINTTHQQAMAFACGSCHGYFVYDLPGRKVFKFKKKFDQVIEPSIPLNAKGRIHGVMYEVVGFMQKRQIGTQYDWREYVLFNPYEGYASLSEYNGHWNIIFPINDYPRENITNYRRVVDYRNTDFQLYNKYQATVKFAKGEFPSNVFEEKNTYVNEYIAPPFMLIRERNEDEVRWYLAEMISDSDLKSAFGSDITLPERTGVGATQLMKFASSMRTQYLVTLVFIGLILAIQLVFNTLATDQKIMQNTYSPANVTDPKEKAIVTPEFELTGGTSAIQFDVDAPLDNDWFDLDIELINHTTGERFEAAKSLEFYSGYDDGYWSEGSKGDYIVVSSVPDGTYHLNLYPQWSDKGGSNKSFQLTLFRNVAVWSNFYIILVLACIVPAIQFLRSKYFEGRRWMESDFSPFDTDD